jgi:RNAse (barnase) inhibitor barstar
LRLLVRFALERVMPRSHSYNVSRTPPYPMPIYHNEPENDSEGTIGRQPYQSFGCSLLHSGPIALYCSKSVLEEDIDKLSSEAFEIKRFDTACWKSPNTFHREFKGQLGFPEYYGMNLNALRECLGDDVSIADDGGLAIVLTDYDEFTKRDSSHATVILDILADRSRHLQMFGKTLIALVHTKDTEADYGNLGAVTAWWNQKEFLRDRRGQENGG